MARHIRASRKGISPVIATVILVAVAITVAVSVAYWMGGISSLYTRLEKVEISSTSVSKDATTGNYTITINIKNTGSADATLDYVYINGKPYDDASFTDNVFVRESGAVWIASGTLSVSVGTGTSKVIYIRVQPASGTATVAPFTAGTTLDVKLHTAAGKDYPQMVTLT